MNKDELLRFMNSIDFDTADIIFINNVEMVGKRCSDSEEIIYWPIEMEGSGFVQLFKGSIKNVSFVNKNQDDEK